ncbi:MAG: rRNA ((527)-N(7))-methyltransferase RsmG [Gammaproteobacteria bacterium]|jgi:16S rRNA (guanine527-N7)-methyltransferase|nr:rRNA ((527)-N(7))-methyltransferase RsmG [Gammaproteobacteria bacterium]
MSTDPILPTNLLQKLRKATFALSLDISNDSQQKLIDYLALLSRWNQAFNLTAIRDPEEMLIKHIVDSLAVAPYVKGARLIDVGSGAGLPGLVLALISPDQQWTLLDSNGKKTRFLLQAKAVLGLQNVTVVHSRVEEFRPAHCFDGVIARAWASIHDMLAATKHLYCEKAMLWAMKGVYPEEELSTIDHPYTVHRLVVPRLNEQRHLVCILTART